VTNKDGIHHVIRHKIAYGKLKSYCGLTVYRFDMPIELDHARACVMNGTYVQPCKNCMKSALKSE